MEYISRVQARLEEGSSASQQDFLQGGTLTVTARRAPHRRAVYEELKPVLENPGGVRLRISATALPWDTANPESRTEAWEVLHPVSATRENGDGLEIAEDGTIYVPGDDPTRGHYQIVTNTPLERLAAVRLEVLPEQGLSPDRSIPDLFVLAEFQVHVSPPIATNQEPKDIRVIP